MKAGMSAVSSQASNIGDFFFFFAVWGQWIAHIESQIFTGHVAPVLLPIKHYRSYLKLFWEVGVGVV